MNRKSDSIEVDSASLQSELIEIKERLGSLETVTSLANRKEVEAQARSILTTPSRREIMKKCEQPKTRDQLKRELKYVSVQALDHHLNPVRDGDLIHQRTDTKGTLTFEWSRLFKSLPKQSKAAILAGTT